MHEYGKEIVSLITWLFYSDGLAMNDGSQNICLILVYKTVFTGMSNATLKDVEWSPTN